MLITATDLISKSWNFYVKNWRNLLVYMGLLLLPTLVMSALGLTAVFLTSAVPATKLLNGLIMLTIFAASLVFGVWVSIALTKAMGTLAQGGQIIPWKNVFNSSSYLIWPVIYTSFLTGIIIFISSLFFILPGILYVVFYTFIFCNIIFEDKKGWQSLEASIMLASGRWWAVAWRLLVLVVIFGLGIALAQYLLLLPAKLLHFSDTPAAIYNSVISTLLNVLVAPLTAAASLLLYLSTKENPTTPRPSAPVFHTIGKIMFYLFLIAVIILISVMMFKSFGLLGTGLSIAAAIIIWLALIFLKKK